MAADQLNLRKVLGRHFGAQEDLQVVLDRRQGERRQRVQAVELDQRRADRRQPLSMDFGELRSFLGEGTQLRGELRFAGAVRVDGRLEGESVRGEALMIGERGQVRAEIEVEILQVSGEVHGSITARQRVELLGPSRVTATIRTPCLVIWKGAVFNGKCEMPTAQGNATGSSEGQEEVADKGPQEG